jgi:hypothetical protein
MSGHRVGAAAVAACACTLPLAACTTTQERSAALAKNAEQAAQAKRFRVGTTNAALTRSSVTTLSGTDARTVVVKITNASRRPQVVVPIGVDLYDGKDAQFFTNRVDGLDMPLNHVPVAGPGTTWWVNNQLPAARAARTRVRIGTSKTTPPAQLPEIRVSGVNLTKDGDVHVARGKVTNLSAVEQRRLTVYGVALRGERVVAAGRAVIEKLGPKGSKRQRFNLYFTGDPTGATLVMSAPPSTLGDA